MEEVATCSCGGKTFVISYGRLRCFKCDKEYCYSDLALACELVDMVNVATGMAREELRGTPDEVNRMSCGVRGGRDVNEGMRDARLVVGAMLDDACEGYRKARKAMIAGTDLSGRPIEEAYAEAGENAFLRADQLRMALDKMGDEP